MAFDSYLKIASIEGESTAKGYEKWIELLAFSHGVSQHSGGSVSQAGGMSGGRADHGEFIITHNMDKSTPKLALACSTGEHIKDITVAICRQTGDKSKFMEYKMSDVIVRSVNTAGAGKGEPLPTEQIAFSYAKIEWTYTEYDNTGKKKGDVKAGWDVAKGVKC